MRLTVLGNSARYLVTLGAGTTYLVEADGARLLVDPGNGTRDRLAAAGAAVEGILATHFHEETFLDLLAACDALPDGAPLLLPWGAIPRVRALARGVRGGKKRVDRLDLRPLAASEAVEVAGFAIRLGPHDHGCPGVSVRFDRGGRALTIAGDTRKVGGLAALARGTGLLVVHTLLLDREAASASAIANLTAGEAGRLATEAGASRLALSHVPLYAATTESLAEARRHFSGEVLLLDEGATYEV